MTKILVLMGGIIKSIDEVWWKNFSDECKYEIHFALSLWEEFPFDSKGWIKSHTVWLDYEKQEEIITNYQEEIEGFVNCFEEVRPRNTYMMWHKWDRFLKFDKLKDYDLVIKTRADAIISNKAVKKLKAQIEDLNSTHNYDLAIPAAGDYRGGLNDIFVVGQPKKIMKYLELMRRSLDYYNGLGFIHPESYLRYHLIDKNSYQVKRFPMDLVLHHKIYNGYNFNYNGLPFLNYIDKKKLTKRKLEIDRIGKMISKVRKNILIQ